MIFFKKARKIIQVWRGREEKKKKREKAHHGKCELIYSWEL